MKRTLIVLGAVVALGLGAAGCHTTTGSVGGKAQGVIVTMPDGRQVPCIVWDGTSYAGGLSCDWN